MNTTEISQEREEAEVELYEAWAQLCDERGTAREAAAQARYSRAVNALDSLED